MSIQRLTSTYTQEIIRVLITGVGHPIAQSTIESLRRTRDHNFYVVGVDLKERGRGFDWVDKHYIAPPGNSKDYIPAILDICRKKDVHVVVPWSDDEVEAVSYAAPAFRELGIATLCGTYLSIKRTIDKVNMLQELKKAGVPVPDFEIAFSPEDIEMAAKRLGYPKRPVIVKPRRGSCGRGLWILDSRIDLMQLFPSQRFTLPALLSFLHEAQNSGKKIPEYLVMQFLKGQDYSVDALASSGEPLFVIPRKRIKTVEGVARICEVEPNPEIRSIAARVIKEFNLHLNINIQVKYSENSGGRPLIYEINPRISGSIIANNAAGINLLYYGILLSLGKPIPARGSLRVHRTKVFRNWNESYTRSKDWFKP